jgi:hypothetical protein
VTRVWNKITSKTGAESVEFVNEVDDDQLPDLPPGFTYVESSYVLYADIFLMKTPADVSSAVETALRVTGMHSFLAVNVQLAVGH